MPPNATAPKHKLKLRPHADFIRAQLDALPVPGAVALKFSSPWRPTLRFYHYHGRDAGRHYSVRQSGGNTYVFRLR